LAKKLLKQNSLKEKSYIVFHPGAKWIPKRWPTKYWMKLIKKVISHSNYPIILLGSLDDAGTIESISKVINSEAIFPFISNDLILSSSIIKMATFCVCNDSAAMHIAAGVNTPAIVLFGPVSPKRAAPSEEEGCSVLYNDTFCSPCTLYYSRNRCRRGLNFCMFAINPSAVHNLIEDKLQNLT
jgi:ADP-heptose:LPS heptosyltransferase